MQLNRRKLIGGLIGASTLAANGLARAQASSYPTRQIDLVIPFPPGGATDVNGRVIGTAMGALLGKPLVTENLSGASGVIGTTRVARAKADGYTLVTGNISTHAIAVGFVPNLPYSPLRDFEPIAHTGKLVNLLVVHPSVPAQSVNELIAYAKANPSALSYGSAGAGGTPHLSAELFKLRTGTSMQHIPYRGGGPMLTDLLGGHVQLAFGNVPELMPHVQAGRLRALGVTSARRWPGMESVPTIQEQGVPDYEVLSWIGLFAPAGIPASVKDRLVTEALAAQRQPQVISALARDNFVLDPMGGDVFRKYVASQITFWTDFLRQTGIKEDA